MKRRILWLGVFGLTVAAATGITVWSISPSTQRSPERFARVLPAGTPVAFNPIAGQPPANTVAAPQGPGSEPPNATYPNPYGPATYPNPYGPPTTSASPPAYSATLNAWAIAQAPNAQAPTIAPNPGPAVGWTQPAQVRSYATALPSQPPQTRNLATTLPYPTPLPTPAIPPQYMAPGYPVYPTSLPVMTAPFSPAYMQNEFQIQGLLATYAATKSDEDREKQVKKITELVTKQFNERQEAHESELKELEKQLKTLRDKHDKREASRKDIIGDRVMQLINQADGLGWTENTANGPYRTQTIIPPTQYPATNGVPVQLLQNPALPGTPSVWGGPANALPLTPPASTAPELRAPVPPISPASPLSPASRAVPNSTPRGVYRTVPVAPGVIVEERVMFDVEPTATSQAATSPDATSGEPIPELSAPVADPVPADPAPATPYPQLDPDSQPVVEAAPDQPAVAPSGTDPNDPEPAEAPRG